MKNVFAILFCAFYMLFFYGIFLLIYRYCFKKKMLSQLFTRRNNLIIFTFFSLCFLAFVYSVSSNRFVYFWDFGGYWRNSINEMNNIFTNVFSEPKRLYSSIVNDDYNIILPVLVALPLKIFGYTFTRYVLLNVLLFLLPIYLIYISLIAKVFYIKKRPFGLKELTVTCLTFLTFTPLFRAILDGYIDIAAVIPMLLSVALFIDYKPLQFTKKQILRDILLSICLLLVFLFRRYFAFYCVGFGISLTIYSAVCCFCSKKKTENIKENCIIAFKNLLITGGIAALLLLTIFFPLVARILSNNYSEQYSGYDAPFIDKIFSVFSHFGIVGIVLAIAGFLIAFLNKKHRTKASFILLLFCLTSITFFSVQAMGDQHIYVIALPVLLGITYFSFFLFTKKKKGSKILACLVLAILCFQAGYFFIPKISSHTPPLLSFALSKKAPVLIRNDLTELDAIRVFVNDYQKELYKTTETSKRGGVYVIASNTILNDSILDSLDLPYSNSSINNLHYASQVDLRDGFSTDFFKADIVVTTEEAATHLAEGSQSVVVYLQEQLTKEDSFINKHYELINDSFVLDSDTHVLIYHRISDYSINDKQQIADYFDTLYPDQKELFSDRILEQ